MAVPFSARCLLFFAAAIQDTRHSVISLVTGVLENPALALPPGNCGRPGFRPGCWIVECDFVIDRVGIETREALDMVIPGALQIRMTLGCSWRLPGLAGCKHRRQQHDRSHDCKKSMLHLKPPIHLRNLSFSIRRACFDVNSGTATKRISRGFHGLRGWRASMVLIARHPRNP